MDRHTALEIVHATLAADCACQVSDLTSSELTVVAAREVVGRRRFAFIDKPFILMTIGNGVVVACSAERMMWAELNLGGMSRDEAFSITTLALISEFVGRERQVLDGPHLKYICSSDAFRPARDPAGFTIEMYGRERMAEVYQFGFGYYHALNYRLDDPCPDMIAVVAWKDEQVAGMAGMSADSDELWQIGIEIAPAYQGKGLGKALVSRATEAALAQEKVPYYATRLVNIASGNTARSVGYQLAWSDVYARNV
jgi:GNAT superfamily N-acetyltransferase